MTLSDLHNAFQRHDATIAALGYDVWIGMEPTFTRRYSTTPEWLSEALGPEKLSYAYQQLAFIRQQQPGGVVFHPLGRQYSGEALPRWCLGYYRSRNDSFNWDGPPDPVFAPAGNAPINLDDFWRTLCDRLNHAHPQGLWQAEPFASDDALNRRILLRRDGERPLVDVPNKPALSRCSIHQQKIPLLGLTDELAQQGDLLICLGLFESEDIGRSIRAELPDCREVAVFFQVLSCLAAAAKQAGLTSLRLQGFPPPVDQSVAWTTLTPDPAVVEINMAPAPTVQDFFEDAERCYQAAAQIGLASYRLQFNGVVSDSGGGGQFTLGGPSATDSPFLRYPMLLPRLLRYLNAHPALSYWFAPSSIGSYSQSPRPDEGVNESFQEFKIALEQLEKAADPQPGFIWHNLSPFLVDPSGNQHRSELNIEKLWNPFLPGRGCMGLVEFRAFRMPRSAQAAAAIAALLRAIVAMLIREDKVRTLIEHGADLHDQYALPFYLRRDLQQVFEDLHGSRLGLGDAIENLLVTEPVRLIGRSRFAGYLFELEQALEYWPLIGDVASQEQGGSRMIDGSTSRLQITVRPEDGASERLTELELRVEGYHLPMRLEQDRQGPVLVFGLRYRSFRPLFGLHPGIAPLNDINFSLSPAADKPPLKFSYHEWHPEGIAYPGLPENLQDAEQRRRERLVLQPVDADSAQLAQAVEPPPACLSDYCFDLRRL